MKAYIPESGGVTTSREAGGAAVEATAETPGPVTASAMLGTIGALTGPSPVIACIFTSVMTGAAEAASGASSAILAFASVCVAMGEEGSKAGA